MNSLCTKQPLNKGHPYNYNGQNVVPQGRPLSRGSTVYRGCLFYISGLLHELFLGPGNLAFISQLASSLGVAINGVSYKVIVNTPHPHTHPHRFIRAQHYQYTYTRLGSKAADEGHWWERELIGQYFPVVSKEHLQHIAKQQGWTWYNKTKS